MSTKEEQEAKRLNRGAIQAYISELFREDPIKYARLLDLRDSFERLSPEAAKLVHMAEHALVGTPFDTEAARPLLLQYAASCDSRQEAEFVLRMLAVAKVSGHELERLAELLVDFIGEVDTEVEPMADEDIDHICTAIIEADIDTSVSASAEDYLERVRRKATAPLQSAEVPMNL